jgi:hypothetical protein
VTDVDLETLKERARERIAVIDVKGASINNQIVAQTKIVDGEEFGGGLGHAVTLQKDALNKPKQISNEISKTQERKMKNESNEEM